MAVRNPGNNTKLMQDQYSRLKDALEGFYAGKDVQALNIAVTIRVLLHETKSSKSLLSRLHSDYWKLTIYDKPPLAPKTVFALRTPLVISGDGAKRIIRPQFDSDLYQLVPLNRPNMAYGIAAQAGCELQDYLERHFQCR
jgi:hypothetical protein